MKTRPKDATHWSVRAMATSQKVSPATVQRIWKKHKLQPHRVESFKFSTDPEFAPKARDIVGLYPSASWGSKCPNRAGNSPEASTPMSLALCTFATRTSTAG